MSLEHFKEKALHALFSLNRHTNLSKLEAALACQIFDTMISPILTYIVTVKFGVCMPNQTLRPGTAHKSSRLNNKASNIACRAELGRFPLNITINQKILKYILYIQSKDEESLLKQAFLMSFDFQHSQKLVFYRSFKTDHTSSSYLDSTRRTAGRRALVKLRISNHKLMIEIGRYNQTTKDNRHCPFCGCNAYSMME